MKKIIKSALFFLTMSVIMTGWSAPYCFGEIPVYRLYNTILKVHLYSTDANEKSVLEADSNWDYEGVVWNGYESDIGQYPVYRLYSPVLGKHLFTMDGNEKNTLNGNGVWVYEMIAFYANASPYSGDIPIYRLYSDMLKQHLYTADLNEKNTLNGNGVWVYEGIAYYTKPYQGGGIDSFDDINLNDIKSIGMSSGNINGSDNADNQIPVGTILVYRTDENRYGKMKILSYGYNLTLKWATYNSDGSIFKSGENLLIKGTWAYDMDYGIESDSSSQDDFWWKQVDSEIRYIVPRNGAQFALYQSSTPVPTPTPVPSPTPIPNPTPVPAPAPSIQNCNDFSFTPNVAEYELHTLINQYRQQNSLPVVSLSKSLTYVARAHVRDLDVYPPSSPCNAHSWSDNGVWSSCCYTPDHANASCMWDKPYELTPYEGDGYENSCSSWTDIDAISALESWKGSPPHNAVILNQGTWSDNIWNSIGVGIYGSYAVIWFGEETDPCGYF